MKPAVITALWICVIAVAGWLRFERLDQRPFHADEATGACLAARRMESGEGQFDPKHFHGPLLADLAIPLCRMRGETCWEEMTKGTLRTLPAMAGTLLVLLPLLWRRRCGDLPMLLAAALLATSPLLVYYSRMFIHESLLALLGMAALLALTRRPRWAIPGVLVGLMYTTKESFAISLIAWTGAGLLVAWENRQALDRATLAAAWRQCRWPVALSLLAAAVTTLGVYSDGFRHPQGALDALRTFFVYQTGAGHDKPWSYYLQLLALPAKSGGVWWYGTPLFALALFAYAATFRRGPDAVPGRASIRFVAYAAAGHFLIYSLIAYKTPWLACLPLAHVCLLGGCAFAGFSRRRPPLQIALALLAGAGLVTQFQQARHATGRYAADARNPYAYVPTQADIERLVQWLDELRKNAPGGTLEPIAVIGTERWPLPWYLRSLGKIDYWPTLAEFPGPPEGLAQLPLVFALPDAAEPVMTTLGKSHMPLLRGLRANVPLYVFVRNDVWQRWMDPGSR